MGTQMKMSHSKSSPFSLLVSAGIEKGKGPLCAGGARGPAWCSVRLVVKQRAPPGPPVTSTSASVTADHLHQHQKAEVNP